MTDREFLRLFALLDKYEQQFAPGKKVVLKYYRRHDPRYLIRSAWAWHKTRPFIKQAQEQWHKEDQEWLSKQTQRKY